MMKQLIFLLFGFFFRFMTFSYGKIVRKITNTRGKKIKKILKYHKCRSICFSPDETDLKEK